MDQPSSPKAKAVSTLRLIYTATKHRLETYKLFSDGSIRAVAKIAEKQASYTHYADFFHDLGIPKPHLHVVSKKVGVPVVDIPARPKKEQGTIVIHLPMSNPLDENQLYHVATAAAALPAYRIIAFGNPSGKPYYHKEQNTSWWQLFLVAFTGNRRALVAAEIDYLRQANVTAAHHVGYSYGSLKAMVEAEYLTNEEIASLTLIDPVAHPRSLYQLLRDFRGSFPPMARYVERTAIPSYFEARREAAKTKHHKQALHRPVSVAIGILLARYDFMSHLEKIMQCHPNLRVTVAWGTKSELGNDAHMTAGLQKLAQIYPEHINRLRLYGDYHAFGNDIHLYAAIIYTAMSE